MSEAISYNNIGNAAGKIRNDSYVPRGREIVQGSAWKESTCK